MKNVLCVILFLLTLSASSQAQQLKLFTISGDVSHVVIPIEKMYIRYYKNDQMVMDSCMVTNGKYSFTDSVYGGETLEMHANRFRGASPEDDLVQDSLKVLNDLANAGKITEYPADIANKRIEIYQKYNYTLIVSPTKISLTSGKIFSDIECKGDPYQDEYLSMWKRANEFSDRYITPVQDSMKYYEKHKDTVNYARMESRGNSLSDKMNEEIFLLFAKEHPASPVSLLALNIGGGYPLNVSIVAPIFQTLNTSVTSLPAGITMQKQLSAGSAVAIGKTEVDFTMNDTSGKSVKLSSFKGKYVLLDFWASWCGPCRAENPRLLKTYNVFKNKNFVIVGVSLDDTKEKWMKAIHHDQLDWYHLSDLKGWNNAAAKLYSIGGIPDNFLIDPNGIIIGRNLKGEELSKKLAAVLN